MIEDTYESFVSITNEQDEDRLLSFGKAFSSPLRIRLLRTLLSEHLTLVEIAHRFDISNSNALFHLSTLEEAGLVESSYLPSKKGIAKVYTTSIRQFSCLFHKEEATRRSLVVYEQHERIGNYVDADFSEFRFAIKDRLFRPNLSELFSPERRDAELLWTRNAGFVEYAFSNSFCFQGELKALSVSFEVCSETINFRRDWKSELILSINGQEVGAYLSTGDFGDRKGLLNPDWWSDASTQYGHLVTLTVTDEGSFINDKPVSQISLSSLNLSQGRSFRFRLACDASSNYCGGFNLFGAGFGDFAQDIIVRAEVYVPEQRHKPAP